MNRKQHFISFRASFVCMVFFLLTGLLLPFKTAHAQEYASTKECVELISGMDPKRFIALDNLKITTSQFQTIQEYARQLVNDNMTETEKVQRIYEWARDFSWKDTMNCPTHGLDQDDIQEYNNPYHMFKYKRGVCQGYSHLVRTMMTAIGIPSVVVNGELHDPNLDYPAHAWNLVYCDGKWGFVDAAWHKLFLGDNASSGYSLYEALIIASSLETDGEFDYGFNYGFGVVGYKGNAKVVTLPESFNGKEVTSVDFLAFTGDNIEKIILPKTIRNGILKDEYHNPPPFGTDSLKEYVVDPDNPAFSSYHGILCDKNISRILLVPKSMEEAELPPLKVLDKETMASMPNLTRLKIADGTERVEAFAFDLCQSLQHISIPASVTYIDENAFSDCDVTTIYAPEGSAGATYAKANNLQLKDPSLYGGGNESGENPVDPNPIDPNPVDPNPVDPNPVDPNPVDPNPVDPNPVDPNPVDPNPVDPNPVDPNPVDPDPIVPITPVDPSPIDPVKPADPNRPDNNNNTPKPSPGSDLQTPGSSDIDVITPAPTTLKKVTGIRISRKKSGTYNVSWKKAANADGYQLYRYQNGKWKKYKTIRKQNRITLKQTSKKTVQYRIRAYKKTGKTFVYGSFSKKFKITAGKQTR